MSERFTVYFNATTTISVDVEAEDAEAAIDLAYEELPGGLCIHCSGWDKSWGRDEGEFEPDSVSDATGEDVWTARRSS